MTVHRTKRLLIQQATTSTGASTRRMRYRRAIEKSATRYSRWCECWANRCGTVSAGCL